MSGGIDLIILGLGNIGKEYQNTRHNIGFKILDYFCSNLGINFTLNKKFNSMCAEFVYDEKKILLLEPTTFMNLSGIAVSKVIRYYKISLDKLIVIHDDLDLAFCRIKCKIGGSAGGHNGLKSIDSMLTNKYYRVRIGIDRPQMQDVSSYVLGKFNKHELEKVDILCELLYQNLSCIVQANLDSLAKLAKIINDTAL